MRKPDHSTPSPITFTGLLKPLMDQPVWGPPVVLVTFLLVINEFNFLLFHTLAELFSIIVAVLMYAVAWQTARFSRHDFFTYLACGYFWIGALDGVHTLVYKGIDIFPVLASQHPATQFWVAARYCEALLLLSAPLFLTRAVSMRVVFTGFGIIAALLYAAIMGGFFPEAFIDGQGLTPFKIYSEYIIIVLLAAALVQLVRNRELLKVDSLTLLCLSILLTMGAEFAFTTYISVYGFSNTIGHAFKFFSFWFLFIAIARDSLVQPYVLLQEEINVRKLAEEHFAKAFHASPGMYSISTMANGRHVDVNQKWLKTLGYTRDEVIGKTAAELHIWPNAEFRANMLKAFGEQENLSGYEGQMRAKDGTLKEVLIALERIDLDGVEHLLIISQDITAHKASQRQLIQHSKLATLGELAAGLAHELNQPLNNIRLITESLLLKLKRGNLDGTLAIDRLQHVDVQIQRMAEIMGHILIFSRQDDAVLTLFDPARTIENAVSLVRKQAEVDGIKINLDLPVGAAPILGRPVQLEQVILNILSNAQQAIVSKLETDNTHSQQHITVTLRSDVAQNAVYITITDTGGGIPEHLINDVFEPFFTTKDIGQGTGLGLSISYSIITAMGGTFSVANTSDGCAFSITLPGAVNPTATPID